MGASNPAGPQVIHQHDGGKFVAVADGEVFRCACGAALDGSTRGPRGGRRWKWVVADGSEFCSPACPAREERKIEEADDSARAAWEEEEGERRYGGGH